MRFMVTTPFLDDYTGVVVDMTEGERLAATLGDKKAIVLKNHGHLTVGQSVEEATWWYVTMERSCQAQLLAEAQVKPSLSLMRWRFIPKSKSAARFQAGSAGNRYSMSS